MYEVTTSLAVRPLLSAFHIHPLSSSPSSSVCIWSSSSSPLLRISLIDRYYHSGNLPFQYTQIHRVYILKIKFLISSTITKRLIPFNFSFDISPELHKQI